MTEYDDYDPIMLTEPLNSTECVCSDLQHEDYSLSYVWFNYILIMLALPTLSVFGVATNIVNVYIYTRKRMQTSANTYLMFLACSDFLVILTGLFIFWIDSARSYIPELARAPYTTVYTLPFGYMAQTCSIYFTVAAAVDCYVGVCCKSIKHKYCTVKRAKQINICIAVCSVIYNSLRFPQFNLRKCFHDGSQEMIIEICPTSLFFTINTIYNVYMYMVLMTLLPFLFLLILNAIIVVRQSAEASHKSSLSSAPSMRAVEGMITTSDGRKNMSSHPVLISPEPPQIKDDSVSPDDTITMIMVVVLFLCCNTLALIVNVIETFFEPDTLLLNFLTDGSNFLVILNSSVNCLIYLIFNTEYRQVFIITARRAWASLRTDCCKCGSRRRNRAAVNDQLVWKRASVLGNGIDIQPRPTSLLRKTDKRDIMQHEAECTSPVWQPLTSQTSDPEDWPDEYGFEMIGASTLSTNLSPATWSDPNRGATPVVDEDCERDSGWDDTTSNHASAVDSHVYPRSWIAEVKILDGSRTGSAQPHIYVKPLSSYGTRKLNSTAI